MHLHREVWDLDTLVKKENLEFQVLLASLALQQRWFKPGMDPLCSKYPELWDHQEYQVFLDVQAYQDLMDYL